MNGAIDSARLPGFVPGNRPFARELDGFRTTDFDLAREHLFSAYLRHRFECPRSSAGYRFMLQRLQLPEVAVNVIGYGGRTLVESEPTADFYCLQLSVRGTCRIEQDGVEVALPPGSLYVISPHHRLRQVHPAGYVQINARLGRGLVEAFVAADDGGRRAPLEFVRAAFPASGAARPLAGFLRYLCEDSASDLAPGYDPAAGLLAERTLLALLMAVIPSNRGERSLAAGEGPAALRRALGYMRDNRTEALTVAGIAGQAGVSERTLFDLFRRHRRAGPMAVLKDLRFEQARAALLRPAVADDSVTTVALRCGFNHLSKFAAEYRRRYGETPRETLGRSRRVHSPLTVTGDR